MHALRCSGVKASTMRYLSLGVPQLVILYSIICELGFGGEGWELDFAIFEGH